ncbi:MAG: DNA repair protein RecO [Geobacter sp.]|nr:DNA repair protein RecO [Geobacter sp.]
METARCEAIVLKLADYRENDRLVTVYTLEHGLLSGVARGAKRSVRRFGGALELFARLQLQVGIKPGLCSLLEAEIITIHQGIRTDIERIAHAGYACELLAALSPEGMANPRLFRLLTAYLDHLDRHPADPSNRRFFEINLLNILGYRPSLDGCSRCGSEYGHGAGDIRHHFGELLCRTCAPAGRHLTGPALELLALSLRSGRFGAVSFPEPLLAEAGELMDSAIASHLAAPLRSLAFLREIEHETRS